MKYIVALFFLVSVSCFSQLLGDDPSIDQNYVHEIIYLSPFQVGTQDQASLDQKIESVSYFDGLGRATQVINARAGGDKQNIVSYINYDEFGRTPQQYLPFSTDDELTDGYLKYLDPTILVGDIQTFYNQPKYGLTLNPYSETSYEASPLNRVKEQGAPGNSWAVIATSDTDHTIKFDYRQNDVNEVYRYSVSYPLDDFLNPQLTYNGYFEKNSLFKTVIKDENWKTSDGDDHTTVEYKNLSGQVVLKKTYNDGLSHETYYIYDDFGNLVYVLSPSCSDKIVVSGALDSNYLTTLDDLGYQYRYDTRNRLVEKKIPGKGWEYIVYDKLDRPILTRDANLQANGQWLFTKYDALGRVAYTGIYSPIVTGTRISVQAEADITTILYETQQPISISISTTSIYYTKNSYPTNDIDVLTINYYDTYVDIPTAYINLPTAPIYGVTITSNIQGLPTVGKVRVLETDDWITTLTAYDDKARPIYSASYNEYLDTTDWLKTNLDFIGIVLQSESYHKKGADSPIITKDYFTYDHQNRLLTQFQDVDNNGLELIVENTYDELGQLTKKRVGGQLFKSGYTDLVEVEVTPEGVIQKTSPLNNWNAGIATIGKMTDDGGISYTVVNEGDIMIIGLNDINSGNGFEEIEYAFKYRISNTTGEPIFQIRIDSTVISGTNTPYLAGDNFAIERTGTVLEFIHKGDVVYTHTIIGANPPLLADASFRSPTSAIENLYFYATTIDKVLQEVDYIYNIRGWLKEINPIADLADEKNTDLFSFKINYTQIEGDAWGVGLYNGNIAQTIWQTANDDTKRGYGYTYDDLNRITGANSKKGNTLTTNDVYHVNNVTYDKNGNILSLYRDGQNGGIPVRFDDLAYTYNGNQLQGVIDNAVCGCKAEGFNDTNSSDNDFTYDVNGNMITDDNKNIVSIEYNHLNLPRKIVFDNALFDPEVYPSSGKGIIYVYDATGVKLEKRVIEAAASVDTKTTYAGNFMYQDDALQFFNQPEGYTQPVFKLGFFSHYEYVYQFKDHLGNIRLSYSDNNRDGSVNTSEIIEESNYYPFGLKQKGYNNVINGGNDLAQNWKFGGKEYNQELDLNWYDVSARNYDPALGRWMNIDPLAELMTRHSPYNYAFDNPIFFIDPDGNAPAGFGGIVNWGNQNEKIAEGADEPNCTDCKKCPETCNDAKETSVNAENKSDTSEYDNSVFITAGVTTGILIADDLTVVGVADDVAIPFVWLLASISWTETNKELIIKQLKEIDRTLNKKLGGLGITYELIATHDGLYPVLSRGSPIPTSYVHLDAGDVWKFGESTKPLDRYSLQQLNRADLTLVPLFSGTVPEIKAQEKIMIYGYFFLFGKLPPGNKIFR